MKIITEAASLAKRLASKMSALWGDGNLTPEQRARINEMESDYQEFVRNRANYERMIRDRANQRLQTKRVKQNQIQTVIKAVTTTIKKNIAMKKTLLLAALLTATSVFAQSNSTDVVKNAVAKLKDAPNYSWTTTTKMPGMQFEMGAVKGSTEKGGYSKVSQSFNDNTMEAIFKGDKVAVKGENDWQLASEAEGMGAMMSRMLVGNGTPADDATKLLTSVKELKLVDGCYSADLSADAAAGLMPFGRRDGNGPAPKDAKGSLKFWVKDNVLSKYESNFQGKVSFGPDGEERDMQITRTVEIQNAGSTKVEVPEAAKKKLEAK